MESERRSMGAPSSRCSSSLGIEGPLPVGDWAITGVVQGAGKRMSIISVSANDHARERTGDRAGPAGTASSDVMMRERTDTIMTQCSI